MNEINVLILSAGRRVELVQAFQKAAKKLNISSKIIAGDCSDLAPALYFADQAVELPKISDPAYIQSIIDISCECNVHLIVPTIDTDLLLLAQNKELIERSTKATVLISSTEVITICRDKFNTHQFLSEQEFGVPKLYHQQDIENDTLEFPLFIKPKSGSSSINAYQVNNKRELQLYSEIISEPIIQEYIQGDEYTVDAFLDFHSNIISIVPRLRIATRSGEIAKGQIVKDRAIIESVRKLLSVLKPIGHITIQLMKTQLGIKYIEINPRFGGGAPMSIKSGADSCEYLFRLLMGENLSYCEDYQDGLIFLRFDSSICLNKTMELIP